MKVAILGFGKQGLSAYNYWRSLGAEITICDQNEKLQLPDKVQTQLGPSYLDKLDRFDYIVRSPSVHPSDIIAANTASIIDKVTTVTNEFFKVSPSSNIIGVTGTKGKGTTSTLVAQMLEATGKRVHLGGNIGTPPLDLLAHSIHEEDWVVLELANFQLIDLNHSPHIGICLMVVPEHLDWHKDAEEYYKAKMQMFAYQSKMDLAIYYGKNDISRRIAGQGYGKKIPYMIAPGAYVSNGYIMIDQQQICATKDLKLLGEHNWQNICAALTAVWQVSKNKKAIATILTHFSGLEHRLEKVRILNDITYYDDSFGTTPETSIVALKSFQQPKVIILGGSDKGASYDELARIISESNVRFVVLIGEQADRIRSALEKSGFTNLIPGGKTMQEIVTTAQSVSQAGDIVLLSTACASFDMFKNYIDRGDQFKAIVKSLA